MSAAPVRPSTAYANAVPAIIAHPLALQVNSVFIFTYSITLCRSPWVDRFVLDPVDQGRPY
jgi:hypothetical protein